MNTDTYSIPKYPAHPPFKIKDGIDQAQLDYFDRNGFIHFKGFIDKSGVQSLLSEVESVERHLMNSGRDKVNGIPLKFGYDHVKGRDFIQRIAFTSQFRYSSGFRSGEYFGK